MPIGKQEQLDLQSLPDNIYLDRRRLVLGRSEYDIDRREPNFLELNFVVSALPHLELGPP
jgi:hypothetical protein